MLLSSDEVRILLKRAQAGDKRALDEVARCCRPFVLAVCREFFPGLEKADEADQAAQDALLRFLARIHTVDPTRNWVAYLATVTRTICLTRLRKPSGFRKLLRLLAPDQDGQPAPVLDVPAGIRSDPVAALIVDELNEDVQYCLGRLTKRSRMVLDLHYLAEVPADELAAHWPEAEKPARSTLYNWVAKAKAAMGRCLEARGLVGDAKKNFLDWYEEGS